MDAIAPRPQVGVALQYNPKITRWFPFFDEPLDAVEILLDSFIGALDGPHLLHPPSVARLVELQQRFTLLGHSNYGGDFGFDPIEETAAMRRHVPLVRRLACPWVSDHCFYADQSWSDVWSSPVQFSEVELDRLARRARALQDAYGVPLGHENAAYYRVCPGSTMPEAEFIAGLVERAGTYLHLDLHNVFANEVNFKADGYSVAKFLDTIPLDRVIVIHVAGGRWLDGVYHDLHDTAIPPPIWDLLDEVLARSTPGAVVLEWETDYLHEGGKPVTRDATIATMQSDLARAREAWDRAYGPHSRITTRELERRAAP
jgi:uncharacterized protein